MKTIIKINCNVDIQMLYFIVNYILFLLVLKINLIKLIFYKYPCIYL
jgi:hypothetical protein